jgi:hypothetical protein
LFVCLFVWSLCLWWSRAQRPGPRRYVASILGRSAGGTLGTHAWGSAGQCRLVTGALGHTVDTHSTRVHTHTCPRTRPATMQAWLVRTHAHTTSRTHMHTHSTGTHACTGVLTRTHTRTRIRTHTRAHGCVRTHLCTRTHMRVQAHAPGVRVERPADVSGAFLLSNDPLLGITGQCRTRPGVPV